jgi:GT2 family glycosyltransferase
VSHDGAPDDVRLSVIVVTYNSADAVKRCLPALASQLSPRDELIVVDNGSRDGTVEAVATAAPRAQVLRSATNPGYSGGCNAGAAAASGDLLVLLNPDALPAPGFAQAIRRPALEHRGWAAWMGLVTMDGGRRINTSGGVVHFTGIAWAGDAGRPVEEVPPGPVEVSFVSGACLCIPLETWRRHQGFAPGFFMYCEDVELSCRLRLEGGTLGLEPRARVDHDYTFVKGAAKWRLLERNRWATLVRTYPAPLLLALAPALAVCELAMLPIAAAGGWLPSKLAAIADTLSAVGRLRAERAEVQARSRIGAVEFARLLTPELGSVYLGAIGRLVPLRWAMRAYWQAALALLRTLERRT